MKRLLLLALSACSFEGANGSTGPSGDDDPLPCESFSEQFDTCPQAFGGPLVLDGSYTFDTDTATLAKSGTPVPDIVTAMLSTNTGPVTAILVEDLRFAAGATLRATGSQPIAIVSRDAIVLDAGASIDVSDGGAGARGSCSVGAKVGADDAGGAAGGGGGAFGGAGGTGGNGDSGGSAGGTGGAPAALPSGPIGGCPGAMGGAGDDGDPGGSGGAGGGAIYLVAAVHLSIAASAGLHAGGGGGGGGSLVTSNFGDAGGGGGGSGGMLLLEAPEIRSSGILAANGGGGGEASGNGEAGRAGAPGPFGTARALGGASGSSTGTDGGDGGHYLATDGSSVTTQQAGGGGGGGGGVGFVRAIGDVVELGSNVSPPAQ